MSEPNTPPLSIEAQLAVMNHQLKTQNGLLIDLRSDHEARIRRLEKWIWVATGIAAAAGSAGGQILAAYAR